jgi:cyclohexyl-isocyanide hydratase
MGDRVAKMIQLALEYDPHPPYDASTAFRPDADAELVESVRSVLKKEDGNLVAALGAAGLGHHVERSVR